MALTLTCVIDTHLACCLGPVNVRLVLGLCSEVRDRHDVTAGALTGNNCAVTVLVLCFQGCTSHKALTVI